MFLQSDLIVYSGRMVRVVRCCFDVVCFGAGCISQGWYWSGLSKELEDVGVDHTCVSYEVSLMVCGCSSYRPSSWWSLGLHKLCTKRVLHVVLQISNEIDSWHHITICIQLLVGLFNSSCHFPKWAGNSDFENIVLIDMIPLTQAKITAEGAWPNCQEAQ